MHYVRVRITQPPVEPLDEVEVRALKPGCTYDLPSNVASTLIVAGCAEPDLEGTADVRPSRSFSKRLLGSDSEPS